MVIVPSSKARSSQTFPTPLSWASWTFGNSPSFPTSIQMMAGRWEGQQKPWKSQKNKKTGETKKFWKKNWTKNHPVYSGMKYVFCLWVRNIYPRFLRWPGWGSKITCECGTPPIKQPLGWLTPGDMSFPLASLDWNIMPSRFLGDLGFLTSRQGSQALV